MGLLEWFIRKFVLKTFFAIELSAIEEKIAYESVREKYVVVLLKSVFCGLLVLPGTLFLDTEVLAMVLIPITMVAGSAWFSITLANLKKKFEDFGLELTTNLFASLVSSLIILGLLVVSSLNDAVLSDVKSLSLTYPFLILLSGILTTLAVILILYDLFSGALKYDINDAMLSGQNEAAEKFFRRSLSLLHAAANNLQEGKNLQVANYYFGLSFSEVFNYMKQVGVTGEKIDLLLKKADSLQENPGISQKEADSLGVELTRGFLSFCRKDLDATGKKHYSTIALELSNVSRPGQSQSIIDARMAMVFKSIAELLEEQGESLFKK